MSWSAPARYIFWAVSSSNPINRARHSASSATPRECTGKGRFVVYNFRKEFCQSFTCAKSSCCLVRGTCSTGAPPAPCRQESKNAVLKSAKKRVRAFLIHDPAAYPSKECVLARSHTSGVKTSARQKASSRSHRRIIRAPSGISCHVFPKEPLPSAFSWW